MKYAPKRVFIKENGEYKELKYDEFCRMNKSDESFTEKKFVPMQGCLLEVDDKTYKEIYKEYERNRYVQRLDREHTACCADAFEDKDASMYYGNVAADEFENRIINRLMISKLANALRQLSPDESIIIDLIYYKGMSQRNAAEAIGISQSTFRYRLNCLLVKLKKILNE